MGKSFQDQNTYMVSKVFIVHNKCDQVYTYSYRFNLDIYIYCHAKCVTDDENCVHGKCSSTTEQSPPVPDYDFLNLNIFCTFSFYIDD